MSLNNFIGLASPDINETDIERVAEVLRSGMLIQGKHVAQLEKQFSTLCSVQESIAVSNGTATMHLILHALGITKGDEVIVPAFSYVATANVVELVGATPVFVDIDENTFNINVALIESKITANTKAIIPVHEFGLACDIESIVAIAQKHNLYVIEDAACALGAYQNKKLVGSFGIAGSFSLHPRKSITSGEGGVITSNNQQLSKKLRQFRNHGIEIIDGDMSFEEAGFNYRLTDFQAALAGSQLERLSKIFEKKQTLSDVYFNEITTQNVTLPYVPHDRNHTWQTFHLLLADGLEQKKIISKLREEGIGSNYGAQCIPAVKYYHEKYGENAVEKYPNAWRAYRQGIAVPLYEKLTSQQIQTIAKTLNQIC